jgi:hypothetical protein
MAGSGLRDSCYCCTYCTCPSRVFVTIYDGSIALESPILRRSTIHFRFIPFQAFIRSVEFVQPGLGDGV